MVSWKRNLAVTWIAELLAISGFSLVLPFLPYYVQELGITEQSQVALWSGLLLSSQSAVMAVASPIWGTVADRFGRKPMVVRAMIGAGLTMGVMGFAQNVYQLLALRILMGVLTGTITAATANRPARVRPVHHLDRRRMGLFGGCTGVRDMPLVCRTKGPNDIGSRS